MNLKSNMAFFCLAVGALFSYDLFAEPASGMVLDLGAVSDFIKVTPEYSNAALEAVLPYFSAAAEKLNLPVSKPITRSDIAGFNVLPFRETTVSMTLKNGWTFDYSFGYVKMIVDMRGYSALQNPDEIPRYYGEVKMTKEEAVQFARDIVKKLGIPLEDVFAEQEPIVTLPEKIGTNTIAHYEITWIGPGGSKSADIGINANTKQIDRIYFLNRNLEHPRPKINAIPTSARLDWPSTNPEYARQLIPMMFRAIDEYAKKLSLPIPRPLTTNNVARVRVSDNGGWPDCDVELTNGWRFVYRHTMVNGYFSPKALLTDIHNRAIHIRDFEGKWNLTTNQAIELVKENLAKLNFSTNNIHMDFAPNIIYAAGDFKKIIPRYFFEWDYENAAHDDLQSKVEAEVNADNGKLESLYYDDKAYWDNRPPIDVPISVE
jgi:hypothetical protein